MAAYAIGSPNSPEESVRNNQNNGRRNHSTTIVSPTESHVFSVRIVEPVSPESNGRTIVEVGGMTETNGEKMSARQRVLRSGSVFDRVEVMSDIMKTLARPEISKKRRAQKTKTNGIKKACREGGSKPLKPRIEFPRGELLGIKRRNITGRRHVQATRCMAGLYQAFERCTACIARKQENTCRFANFRVFEVIIGDKKDELIFGPDFESRTDPDPPFTYPNEFPKDLLNLQRHKYIVKSTAQTLSGILERELRHLNQPDVFRRFPDRGIRQLCDVCLTTIFAGYWMCPVCAKEICLNCYDEWDESVVGEPPGQLASVVRCSTTKQSQAKRQHSKDQLVAVSHMSRDECVSVLQETKNIIPISFLNNISLEISLGFDTSKLYFDADHLSFEDFQRHWKMGLPMVITNLGKRSQIRWTPEYFINGQAGQICRCVNSNVQGEEILMKVDEFFAGFDDHSLRKISPDGTPVCLKLKDWPSDADFKDKFPDLFEDFFRSIPFPEYTTREGTLNLASRMPMDFVRPDLGPKMYNAYGSSDKAYGRGTTNLHLDMTDAVNLMMYATPLEQRPEHELREREDRPSTNLREDSPAAVWDLYLPADLPKLREFLRGIATEQNVRVDDPIHDQCFFVDNRYRERLKQEYGISGIRLYQNPGDAVFIPAGCAHQVCNYTSCVKTAVDFVSPEGVERSMLVSNEFRQLTRNHKRKEDILQIKNMIFHAWKDCQKYLKDRIESNR